MPLSSYSELKAAITDFMARADVSGVAADLITLGEAKLNRVLNPVETDATLTGTISSRRIDISSLDVVAPIALFLVNGDESQLRPMVDGTFAYDDTDGVPTVWAIDGTGIDFDRPLDQAYSFRFRYRGKFALSDSVTSNWLLENCPDIYLAASVVWGGIYVRDPSIMQPYKALLEEGIPEVRNILARGKRALATVDPALLKRRTYDWATDT